MTKPPGRPRGRPKTQEYVTLRACVDAALADRIKRYAAAHRQPIAVVIRDALTLLMEEYPSGADMASPHRLAAHAFLFDRYESPLDLLVGEIERAGLEACLADTKETVVDTILSDRHGGPHLISDTNEAMADRVAQSKARSAETRPGPSARARSRKAADGKAATSARRSGRKAALSALPQRKRGRQTEEPHAPAHAGIAR